MDYWLPIIVLFGAFFFMLALGVRCLCHWFIDTGINFHTTRFQLSIECGFPKLASGLDSFTLLVPIFYLVWQHYEPWRNSATINQLCPYSRRSSAAQLPTVIFSPICCSGQFLVQPWLRRLRWAASCIRNRLKRVTTRHSVLRLTLPCPDAFAFSLNSTKMPR